MFEASGGNIALSSRISDKPMSPAVTYMVGFVLFLAAHALVATWFDRLLTRYDDRCRGRAGTLPAPQREADKRGLYVAFMS